MTRYSTSTLIRAAIPFAFTLLASHVNTRQAAQRKPARPSTGPMGR